MILSPILKMGGSERLWFEKWDGEIFARIRLSLASAEGFL